MRTRRLLVIAVLSLASAAGADEPFRMISPVAAGVGFEPEPACADGVVQDDGSLETGYSWVPSVIEGIYVMDLRRSALAGGKVGTACVCWTRTMADDVIDFDVVLYADEAGIPSLVPFAEFPATASAVPTFPEGAFYEIDIQPVRPPTEVFYLGVRWNASVDRFFFSCADTNDATPPVPAFFIDDRADEWTSVFETPDPIFIPYRALLIRARGFPPLVPEVPALDGLALAVLAGLLAAAALVALKR